MTTNNNAAAQVDGTAHDHLEASARLKAHCAVALADDIDAAGRVILSALQAGNKLLVCGNGGSAADAQHLASELVGRFVKHRAALPAIALTTDTSALTAISNDYGYDHVFARQVEAYAKPGDVLVVISTSGESRSIIQAAEAGRKHECHVIGLTGRDGGKLVPACDRVIIVPAQETALIQEVHTGIVHAWGRMIEGWYLAQEAE